MACDRVVDEDTLLCDVAEACDVAALAEAGGVDRRRLFEEAPQVTGAPGTRGTGCPTGFTSVRAAGKAFEEPLEQPRDDGLCDTAFIATLCLVRR